MDRSALSRRLRFLRNMVGLAAVLGLAAGSTALVSEERTEAQTLVSSLPMSAATEAGSNIGDNDVGSVDDLGSGLVATRPVSPVLDAGTAPALPPGGGDDNGGAERVLSADDVDPVRVQGPASSAESAMPGAVPETEPGPAPVSTAVPEAETEVAPTELGGRSCPVVPVEFRNNELLAVDGRRSTETVLLDLPCDRYEIVLESHDPRHRAGYQAWQIHESWRLEGLNASGQVTYRSAPTPDLPEPLRTTSFSLGVVDLSDVSGLRGVHAWPGNGIHSVHVGAELRPVKAQEPPSAPPGSCLSGPKPGYELDVADLAGGQLGIDLAAEPIFTLAGQALVPTDDELTAVSVYGDGVLLGGASLIPSTNGNSSEWQYQTSAPPGDHAVAVCGLTTNGVSFGAAVSLSVSEPASDAVVVSPDVVVAGPSLLSSIAEVTNDDVAVSGPQPDLRVGQVLVAGIEALTPNGLARRIESIEPLSGGWRLGTSDVGLTDIFYQARISVPGTVPAQPSGSVESGSGPSASARANAPWAAADLASVAREDSIIFIGATGCAAGAATVANAPLAIGLACAIGVKYTEESAAVSGPVTASGSFVLSGTATATGALYPFVDIDINSDWGWLAPIPRVERAEFGVRTKLTTSFSADVEGKGTVDATANDIIRPRVLRPYGFLVGPIPIVLTPVVSVDAVAQAEASVGLGFQASGSLTATTSATWDGTEWKDTSISEATGSATPIDRVGSGSVTTKILLVPRVAVLMNLVAGPEASLGLGARAQLKLPCPGFDVSLVAEPSLRGASAISWIDDALEKLQIGPYEGLAYPLYHETASGCGPKITTDSLPDGTVDDFYRIQLQARDGFGELVWAAHDLPPGLTLSDDGLLRGFPTAAGTYAVSIGVADEDGATDIADLTIRIGPAGPRVDVAQPPSDTLEAVSLGHPRITTLDGLSYLFHGAGDYQLAATPDGSFEVDLRLGRAFGMTRVSYNRAVAARVGDSVIAFGDEQASIFDDIPITLDGQRIDVPAPGSRDLPGGASLERLDRCGGRCPSYRVVWSTGEVLEVGQRVGDHVRLSVPADRAGNLSGLMGNGDGDPVNDRAARDGELVDLLDRHALYQQFGASWLLDTDDSLFASTPDPVEIRPIFPTEQLTLANLPRTAVEAAIVTCREGGVRSGAGLDQCAFDVAVTGLPDWVSSVVAVQDVMAAATPVESLAGVVAEGTEVRFDEQVVDSLDSTGTTKEYLFDGVAGQAIGFQIAAPCEGSHTLSFDLYDPSGARLWAVAGGICGLAEVPPLPSDGQYALRVYDTGGFTPSYRFTVRRSADLLPNPNRAELTDGRALDIEILDLIDAEVPTGEELVVRGIASTEGGVDGASVVYILDVSDSTVQGSSELDCNGDELVDGDDNFNSLVDTKVGSTLDCEIAALIALNRSLAGTATDVSVVLMGTGGTAADLSAEKGQQPVIVASSDSDGDGVPDIEQVLAQTAARGTRAFSPVDVGGATGFAPALRAAAAILAERPAGQPGHVFFLSDGKANSSFGVAALAEDLHRDGVVLRSYSVGAQAAGCGPTSLLATMAERAGGECFDVEDPSALAAVITAAPKDLESVSVSLDGGAKIEATLNPLGRWTARVAIDGRGLHVVRATVQASDGTAVAAEVPVTGW